MTESSKNFKQEVVTTDFKHAAVKREYKVPMVAPFKKTAPQLIFKEVIPSGS